jgi:proline iminopeptidase
MRKLLIISALLMIICTVITLKTNAQILDSIRYENGFLYYHEYGKGEPIILLSGGPGNDCIQLARMASELCMNHRIILFEQRGTGLSIPGPFDSTTINLNTAVSDLIRLMDNLDLKQAIICGHSWGGSLAMYLASSHPERIKSLILIAPGDFSLGKEINDAFYYNRNLRWSISEKELIDSLIKKREKNGITTKEMNQLNYTLKLAYVADKKSLDTLIKFLDAPKNFKTESILVSAAESSSIDFKSSLKELHVPVYIICGRQDFLSYVSYELKINFPDFKLFWIQNSGHFPMYEQPKTFFTIINNILNN